MWVSPYLNRFIQPDTIIPDQKDPQSWNRYAYALNNPIRYNDPTGHCVVVCTALIGGLLSVAVDYVVTTHVKHEDYTWKKAAVSFTIGAVGGAIGAGLVSQIAKLGGLALGAKLAVPVAMSETVAKVGEVAIGMIGSGITNAALSPAKRAMMDALDGQEVTLGTVVADVQENFPSDFKYGALGYGVGWSTNQFIGNFWQPSSPVVEELLDMHPGQKATIGAMQAASTTLNKSVKPFKEWMEKKIDKLLDL